MIQQLTETKVTSTLSVVYGKVQAKCRDGSFEEKRLLGSVDEVDLVVS
ncbi:MULTISPECIES: hypothetical protein [unclassified Streptomyces]|nr:MULTISPECIES: hypothetical protein [unclassified Streptomyces]MCH0566852.1 hypothetical protein [Streptomyces sp. MUM 2J]MCH0569413.1 hypothetical protein [Streptomyces sp. MUM 136J]